MLWNIFIAGFGIFTILVAIKTTIEYRWILQREGEKPMFETWLFIGALFGIGVCLIALAFGQ